jgi:hypothetical protein
MAVAAAPPDLSRTTRAAIHWMTARNSEASAPEIVAQLEEGIALAAGVRSVVIEATLTQLLSFKRAEMGNLLQPACDTIDSRPALLDSQTLGQAAHVISGATLLMQKAGAPRADRHAAGVAADARGLAQSAS